MNGNNIGGRIKTFREARDLSQQDLSSSSGVSLGLIQQIEQGRHDNPSIKVLNMLSNALEVDIVDLITEDVSVKSRKDINKLKNVLKLKYVPVFEHVPADSEIALKDISKVKAMIPVINRKVDFVMRITDNAIGTGLASFSRKNNYVGIQRSKDVKDKRIYLISQKNKVLIRISQIFSGKIVFHGTFDYEPLVLDKSIKIIGEIVFWSRSALSEA